MGFYSHMMRCVGRRGGGEVKDIYKGYTCWWNEVVMEAVSGKEEAHKAM